MAAQGSNMVLGTGQGPRLMRKAHTQRVKVHETPPASANSGPGGAAL
jgi:hypothetical protein